MCLVIRAHVLEVSKLRGTYRARLLIVFFSQTSELRASSGTTERTMKMGPMCAEETKFETTTLKQG